MSSHHQNQSTSSSSQLPGSPIRSQLSGAHRPSTNPRLHALAKPYVRPLSYSGVSTTNGPTSSTSTWYDPSTSFLSLSSRKGLSPKKSPTKLPAPTTRSLIPHSSSSGHLPRSGSESSLSGGFNLVKSFFSRPLVWLATPSRGGGNHNGTGGGSSLKRDSLSSFGHDVEEGGGRDEHEEMSPSDRRRGKKPGNKSPQQLGSSSMTNGDLSIYDPKHFSVTGRAITGTMLPPLPPHITLTAKSHQPNEKPLPNRTNFSRPLTGSMSMPYLDPPSGLFGSPNTSTGSPRKSRLGLSGGVGGRLTRSSRLLDLDIGSVDADGDDEMSGGEVRGSVEIGGERGLVRNEGEAWSPWKGRKVGGSERNSVTPVKKGTPSRVTDTRDYTLPSLSPFRPPQSPGLHQKTPSMSGLARSATTVNLPRASSVQTDISMGRSGSVKLRGSSSMLFGSGDVNGDSRNRNDDRMSVDGERPRDGSVLDWFMQDRWRTTGSPASIAASRRLGSAAPSTGMPPIRKGQMVWDAEKGFIRESELKASETSKPVHTNEAERILFALESLRKTPLADARKMTPFASSTSTMESIPAELVGSSSRQLRKAVSVPMATAQAGENARRKRDKERLAGSESVMISPYGRRRQVEKAARDERRDKQISEADDYVPSKSQSQTSDARSRSRSMVSDDEMVSEKEPSPSPAPTPRRSTRNKRGASAAPEETATPKARKTRASKDVGAEKVPVESTTPKATPRKGRKKTSPPPPAKDPTPPPVVPTITATAPSPGGSTQSSSLAVYQPRAAGDSSRSGSSLRARNELTHRRHQGAASYGNSRATSPTGESGRYSAREEDLPPMEDLVQAKISLPALSGISFAGFAGTPLSNGSQLQTQPKSQPQPTTTNFSPGVNGTSPASPAKPVTGMLSVPGTGRLSGGLNNRLTAGVSTRPRASSPLASGSIVAAPESPPSQADSTQSTTPKSAPPKPAFSFAPPPTGSTTPTSKPPASSFFAPPTANGDSSDNAKKGFSFGLGKPPAAAGPSIAEAPVEPTPGVGEVPDFFGKKSAPTSGTSTPIAAPAKPFDFGFGAKPAATPSEPQQPLQPLPQEEKDKSSSNGSSFSFTTGAPAKPAFGTNGSSFSFGAPKPVEPAPSPASTPFSFGGVSKHAETSNSPAISTATPVFGKPTSAEGTKLTFSFGQASAPSAVPATSTLTGQQPPSTETSISSPPPSTAVSSQPFGGFGFTKPVETPKPSEPAPPVVAPATSSFGTATASTPSGGFSFGSSGGFGTAKPANGTTEPSKGFTFGGSATTAPATSSFGGFGSTPANNGPTKGFGSAAPTPAASSGFSFGSTAPAPTGFGSSMSTSTGCGTAAPSSGGFGSTPQASGSSFGTTSTPVSSGFGGFGTGSTGGFGATTATAAVSPAPTPATPSFTFGQSQPSPAVTPSFGGFGSQPTATAAPAPATPSFSFGTPTSAQPAFTFGAGGGSTTPSATPNGFSFGANNGSPGIVAPPRFGSPAPGPGSPADGGGFSLGMTENVPGSPSGRKIKPLRRGGVKRA